MLTGILNKLDMNNTDTCRQCETGFVGKEKAVGYTGPCKIRFHIKGSGIPIGEFDILSRKNFSVVWLCQKCNVSLLEIKVSNDIHDIKEKQNLILQELSDMKRKLKERSSTANMGLPVQKKTCQAGAQ
jgi:hypothetical protein